MEDLFFDKTNILNMIYSSIILTSLKREMTNEQH
jgi:hypothetical protein